MWSMASGSVRWEMPMASEYVGQKVTLIPCGGGDRIAAEREQWNDGSNTLCVRPGTVVVYQRNNVTNDVPGWCRWWTSHR